MKTRHHPLLSPIALVSTLFLIAGLAFTLWMTGGRAFSPGDLSAVAHSPSGLGFEHHASFSDDCTQCHTPLQGVTADRCTNCHSEIAAQQAAGEKLHGRLGELACVNCHTEHLGSDVDLVAVALADFSAEDHALLFPLDGAHLTLDCADCHSDGTYSDTPTTCAGCHQEPAIHANQFGTACANCHTTADWQSAALTAHRFPLDHGGMGDQPCASCHLEQLTRYSCANCHVPQIMTDVHAGVATDNLQACTSCHQLATSAETERLQR